MPYLVTDIAVVVVVEIFLRLGLPETLVVGAVSQSDVGLIACLVTRETQSCLVCSLY